MLTERVAFDYSEISIAKASHLSESLPRKTEEGLPMVQVDVFWAYGLSAGLAVAGHKAIKKAPTWWVNKPFLYSVIWNACLFGPSGIFLLWSFPGWETMFVATNHLSIPSWLVTIFSLTNVTQGILGFWVTAKLIRSGHWRAAVWQPIWSHMAMMTILIFGWDGAGYRRFFYAGTGEEWHSGVNYPISAFFSCSVFFSLLGLGVVFLPTYFGLVKHLMKARD